jgi:hypothetical protein
MNFGKLRSCICNLETRVKAIEEGGVGGSVSCLADWDVATTYLPGNAVCYDGFIYVALTENDGNTPSNDGVLWTQVGSTLSNTNIWNSTLSYLTNTVVYHSGGFWVATTDMAPGEEPGVDADWTELIGPVGPAGPQGDPGEIGLHAFVEAPTAKTYVLALYAGVACTINNLRAKTVSGTCTVNIRINGVSVTGLSAVAITSVESSTNASGANAVAVGDTIEFVVSSISSAVDLQLSLLIS